MGLKRTRKRPGPRKRRQATYAALKKKLDDTLSLWIRRKDADSAGMTRCVCCGQTAHWKEVDCGHFVSRTWLATRFDERNVAVQCKTCNGAYGRPMNVSGYAAYLVKTYGPDICHQLDEKKWDTTKFTRSDLEAKIEEFRIRLNNLSNG